MCQKLEGRRGDASTKNFYNTFYNTLHTTYYTLHYKLLISIATQSTHFTHYVIIITLIIINTPLYLPYKCDCIFFFFFQFVLKFSSEKRVWPFTLQQPNQNQHHNWSKGIRQFILSNQKQPKETDNIYLCFVQYIKTGNQIDPHISTTLDIPNNGCC